MKLFTQVWFDWDVDDHNELDKLSNWRLLNVDVKDQCDGGNGNDGKIGESESDERVGVGENNRWTVVGDRDDVDCDDDDHKSPS